MTEARFFAGNARSNPTRAAFCSGATPTYISKMEFVNIATLGNAQEFGDVLSASTGYGMGSGNCASPVRAVLGGGSTGPSEVIQYFSLVTLGNATDFGNLTDARRGSGCGSSATRGIFAGGRDPNESNIIDYIEIATEGNAVDFGDLSGVRSFQPTGMSNAHGGL